MLFLGRNASANTIKRFRKTKHNHLEICVLQPEAPKLHYQSQTLFPDVAHAVGHRFKGGPPQRTDTQWFILRLALQHHVFPWCQD